MKEEIVEHVQIYLSQTGWTKTIIDGNKYPNICKQLQDHYPIGFITPLQYLTYISQYYINIYIQPEQYITGTNYNWQLLGYQSTGLYGDNGEYPTYDDALIAAMHKSFSIIEELILELIKDDQLYTQPFTVVKDSPLTKEERERQENFLKKIMTKYKNSLNAKTI